MKQIFVQKYRVPPFLITQDRFLVYKPPIEYGAAAAVARTVSPFFTSIVHVFLVPEGTGKDLQASRLLKRPWRTYVRLG